MAQLAYGIAETILEKLASKAYEEISLAKSAKDDLKKLGETVMILKSKLNDVEKKQKEFELRIWLVKLKDLLNEAVDVLDEFECEALRRQVVKEFGSVHRKVRRFCSRSNPLVFRFNIARCVKEIKDKFDEVTNDMARFQLISSQLNDHEEQSRRVSDRERDERMTHSFVAASEIIGRDCDKAELIGMLTRQDDCDGNDNLSLVSIVGLGGLGKTTLAKLVFNDAKVQCGFELRLWVCVSSDFDITRLLKQILSCVNDAEGDLSRFSLDQLQTSMRKVLDGKRFLLVLDDVWNEDRVKWLELRQFLTGGAKGSKVLVTTRSTIVSSIMTKTPPHKLQGLSEADSLSLFFRCSFGDEKLTGQNLRLEDIGIEIVKKCGGVPLALKTLGSLLFSKPEAKWISVRDNKIWEMKEDGDHILPALRLSYNAMSSCLKQCFAYCSIFQEDEEIDSLELTTIWMALGYLQSSNGKFELEDDARLHFEELCDISFLQCSYDDESDHEMTMYGLSHNCDMHDLIHDLARSITETECCIVKSRDEQISDSVRILRLFYNEKNQTIVHKLTKLWSVRIDHTGGEEKIIGESFLSSCIKQCRYLRVFDLAQLSFEVLPSSIGELRHLRYLNLTMNRRIKRLPESICNLQSLQTLLLYKCEKLEELPKELRKLVSLRVLDVTTKQSHFPESGIGRLKSLRMLFIATSNNLQALPRDMKYCATLRHLFISNCEKLDLASTDDFVTPMSLQTFVIANLPKTTSLPRWLKGALHTLQKLVIMLCYKLVALPEWLEDFTSLEKLVIKNCPKISNLPNLNLSCLAHLEIKSCIQLDLEIQLLKLKLKTLIIESLPRTTALPTWLRGSSETLQVLEIRKCQNWASLPAWLQDFTSLKKLDILFCPQLSTLPEGMSRLRSLTHLRIRFCHSAFQERYNPENGEDWQNIAHVPNIVIDNPFDESF